MSTAQLPETVTERIGVIGLGTMGGGMAARLTDAGVPVVVHNRTAAAADPLVVVLSLANQDAVESVLFGTGGVAGALRPGGVVLDASTVDPDYARDRARRLADAGLVSLDTCVVGNGEHARAGELRFLVGGEPEVLERVAPLLAVLGRETTHLGPSGSGASLKLVLNMLMGVQMQSLAEAVVLGERAGLDRAAVLRAVVGSGFSSPVMRFKAGVMGRRAFTPPDFRLALMRKDLALVRTEAQRLAVPMAVAEAAYGVLTSAVAGGLGELDCAAVLMEVERLAGVRP